MCFPVSPALSCQGDTDRKNAGFISFHITKHLVTFLQGKIWQAGREHGFFLVLLPEFAFPDLKSFNHLGHTFHMLFKFCVLRKINSWLVKVTFYDNLDTLFIDTCKAHDTASSAQQTHSFSDSDWCDSDTVTHSDSDSDSHSCRTVKSRLKGCHLGVEVTDQEESVLVRHLENAGQRGPPPLLSSSLQPWMIHALPG